MKPLNIAMMSMTHGHTRKYYQVLRDNPKLNWIGGVGTGAYGAVKMALKHSDVFSKAVSIHGILDMEELCRKAVQGEETGTTQNLASLKAVFGDLDSFPGSDNDLYTLADKNGDASFLFISDDTSCHHAESVRLADALGKAAEQIMVAEDNEFISCGKSLPEAIRWLTK